MTHEWIEVVFGNGNDGYFILEPVESCAPTEEGGMQASAPSPNQNIYNQEPPPPPPYVHPGTVISPQTYQENPGNNPTPARVKPCTSPCVKIQPIYCNIVNGLSEMIERKLT